MHTEQLDAGLFRSVAPNGLVILTEHLPAVRSVAAGVWVRAGSGHEPEAQMGISHPIDQTDEGRSTNQFETQHCSDKVQVL